MLLTFFSKERKKKEKKKKKKKTKQTNKQTKNAPYLVNLLS